MTFRWGSPVPTSSGWAFQVLKPASSPGTFFATPFTTRDADVVVHFKWFAFIFFVSKFFEFHPLSDDFQAAVNPFVLNLTHKLTTPTPLFPGEIFIELMFDRVLRKDLDGRQFASTRMSHKNNKPEKKKKTFEDA